MSELADYAARRLELGDMLRAALHIARDTGDEQTERRCRELLARLATDRFSLAVVGQFSRGKTTLMNALLGGAYLPMGALPMTSVITTVRYGSRPQAFVRARASGLAVEVPVSEVAQFIARTGTRRAETQVVSVEVRVPAELLRLGVEFVDTPGVGSAVEVNTATTRRFLPEADAVLFVTGFDSPLTEAETGFLADVSRHAGKLFLAVNKRDLVTGSEARDVLSFTTQRLGLSGSRVFSLSALQALEAGLQCDDERLAGSGLPELTAELREFLTAGKAQVLLRNVAGRAAGLVAGQRRDLELGRLPDAERVLAEFDGRISELQRQFDTVTGRITERVQTSVPGLLEARDAAWRASLPPLLDPRLDEVAVADSRPAREQLEAGSRDLQEAARKVVRTWLQRRTGEVLEDLTGAVAGEIGALLEITRSPAVIGADIAGLGSDDRGDAGWSPEELPDLAIRPPAFTVPAPRLRRSFARPGVRELLSTALDSAIAAFLRSARDAFEAATRDWADRLRDAEARRMRESADRFRHLVRTKPQEADLTALDGLASRLIAFEGELAAWSPGPGDSAVTEAAPVAAGGCVVCEGMEQTLTSLLFRDQFQLATREHEQERHSRGGGFCSLHTWQYASIASPVGISAGYARLAASVADALESGGPSVASVAGLVAASGRCLVCAALRERERIAIAEVVTKPGAVLCLRHLALALSADPDPETARTLVRATAGALRRDSEDMRAFVLKREALHSALATEEESRAHRDALQRLAGRPALVRPWADEGVSWDLTAC